MLRLRLISKEKVEGCKCFPVSITEDYLSTMENGVILDMKNIMKGIGQGLAAPQLGIWYRFFIMQNGTDVISCYNPRWEPRAGKVSASTESCLTYPALSACVDRYKMITAYFTDKSGHEVKRKMSGRTAVIFQHETDHLDGITIFNKEKSCTLNK